MTDRPRPYLTPMALRGRIARPQPKGLPVINMGFNELPYPPTPRVAEALSNTAQNVGRYGSPRCDALRAQLAAANGMDPDTLICGNGSEELLDVIARTFVRAGDTVVFSQYGYIQFALTAHRLGARAQTVAERDFTTDPAALLNAVDGNTKLVFLANPNNPTGTMTEAAELVALAKALPPTVPVVLDLAYGEFAGDAYCRDMHALVSSRDNIIVTRTFSKAYGLAGVRVGWAHAPAWMIDAFYAARGMGSVNALAQAAAEAALQDLPVVADRVAEIVAERDRLADALRGLGCNVLPSHTNFLMVAPPQASAARTEALVEHLFDECGLVVNRTREAGLEPYFRFSLSLPTHNDLLLDGVARFLST